MDRASDLRGAKSVLGSPELKTVMVELEAGSNDESGTIELLQQSGFTLARKHKCLPGVNAGPLGRMHNYFFARS